MWLGPRNGSGYPRMCMRIRKKDGRRVPRNVAVHRIVIEVTQGKKMPKRRGEGMHLCNEQLCCAKTHLKPGTRAENELYKALSNRREREPGED